MDRDIVCPWKRKKTKIKDRSGDGCHVIKTSYNEFDFCEGEKCPFYDCVSQNGAFYTCTRAVAARKRNAR